MTTELTTSNELISNKMNSNEVNSNEVNSNKETSLEERIETALMSIREAIQMDGGDVEFVSYEEMTKTVFVALTGACVGCPASLMTLKMGVERAIKKIAPEVEFVEAV